MESQEIDSFEGYGGGAARYEQLRSELKPDECIVMGPFGLFEKCHASIALLRMLDSREAESP